jgi:hypothetical protein
MGDGKDGGKFGGKERGTGDKGTDSRLTRDPPTAARTRSRRPRPSWTCATSTGPTSRGSSSSGAAQKEFKAAGRKLPRPPHRGQELLRVYKALQDFESALPRGPGGILMQRTPFKPKPVPWPGRPRALSRIPPFSDANVKEWRAAVQEAGAPIPARTPKKYPTGPPKVIKKADDSFFKLLLIKVPGMSLAHSAGKNILMTKILRVLSHQALSEKEAAAIAPKLDIWKSLVLDYGDTVEHKTKVLDDLLVGWEYSVKLKNEFLAEAQKLSPKPLDTKQRIVAPVNEFSREYRPDNSEDERAWYAALRTKGKSKDRDSGYTPGEVVSKDGIVFVGPETGDSMFMAPDGRLYLVHQASLRDQQIEAFRIGVVNAAGGVILAWAVVVLGSGARGPRWSAPLRRRSEPRSWDRKRRAPRPRPRVSSTASSTRASRCGSARTGPWSWPRAGSISASGPSSTTSTRASSRRTSSAIPSRRSRTLRSSSRRWRTTRARRGRRAWE